MMKPEDIKGHLLARKANLTTHGQQMSIRVLQLEAQLKTARSEVDLTQGAVEEIDRTLQLIDPVVPTPAAK